MGNNEPESQSLRLQVWETAKELPASCKEGSPEPGGQQGRWSPQSSRDEPPEAKGKGDQRSIEQHLGVWSLAVSTVV